MMTANQAIVKRTIDIVVASILLVATLPFILLAAIATAVTLRAWPFFTQDRVGRNGKTFRFVKLRTLPTHAPRYTGKYELTELHLPWFSRNLRRLHLDELPQLLLVVVGKMSLVGPRPEMQYLHDEFDPLTAEARTSVRPGCTGLWQVSSHNDGMIYEHLEFDRHYLAHASPRLDAWIVWQTLRVVTPIGGKRLDSLNELPDWARQPQSAPANAVAVEL